MGGREVGGLANLLCGAPRSREPRASRRGRRAVGRARRCPRSPARPRSRCSRPPPTARSRALWIACTNPAQSMPDQATVRRALERCEFVVVQEAFATTATCAFADLLLPATTWGEKDGTVTNSERRISRVRAAVRAPGEARDDWSIAADFARRLEARLRPRRARPCSPTPTPKSVWNEHRETTRGRDLDITGLSYAMLEAAPQQWPLPRGRDHRPRAPVRRRRLRHRRRPRPLRRHALQAGGRGARGALSRSRSTPGACATSGTA